VAASDSSFFSLLTRPAPSWWSPGRRAARRAPLNRPYAALLTVVFRPKEGREPAPAPTSDGRGICSWRVMQIAQIAAFWKQQ